MNFEDLLMKSYAAFNARDIDAVLAVMQPDVDWPSEWEGGRVLARDEVRKYWMRQWNAIDPTVTPERFVTEGDGRITVHVHQVVRALEGNVTSDGMVAHVYRIEDGLIKSMEIRESSAMLILVGGDSWQDPKHQPVVAKAKQLLDANASVPRFVAPPVHSPKRSRSIIDP